MYKSEDIKNELLGIEQWVSVKPLPTGQLAINEWTKIIDCDRFVKSHIAIIRANLGNPTFDPYLQRLRDLREILLKDYKNNGI